MQGRFLPGTVLADRYRIVAPLGKGGMGEVYRADDLKLNQTVALKFLPRELSKDEKLLEYFHSEVRLSRQVSHPNVCRVYDIGEIDGQHFLSMEFIDGEDLRALLRRIGRLPKDKGIDLARQLCSGLAAAHDKGVLHRDLKPANIMIDGRGQARITDFGLAAIATEIAKDPSKAGTPAYMAPEQLTRGRVTIQSDLYALGLILYEMFTGKRAYTGATVDDLIDLHEHTSVTSPGSLIEDMDDTVERVILRCLERDATQRPKSVGAVAAALPGGDPLAAALAAGETPSPEMVAAAGDKVGLKPKTAIACLITSAVLLIGACVFSEKTKLINHANMELPPDALVDRAKQVLENVGYDTPSVDTAHGFYIEPNDFKKIKQDTGAERFEEFSDAIAQGHWPGLRFWYRQAPFPLVNAYYLGDGNGAGYARVEPGRPTPDQPDEAIVMLDPQGRLRWLRIVPPPVTQKLVDEAPAPQEAAWAAWFPAKTLGFDLSELPPADWRGVPPTMADARMAWQGLWPGTDQPLYVEAAAFRGKPVYFRIVSSSYVNQIQTDPNEPIEQMAIGIYTIVVLQFGIIIASVVISWNNYQRRRVDRRGALRLWTTVACIHAANWCLLASHSMGYREFVIFIVGMSQVLWGASTTTLLYIAVEPYVRRYWPQTLITWSRLVDGRVRDPLVGRDLLVGVICGCLGFIFFQLNELIPSWVNIPGPPPVGSSVKAILGPAPLIGAIFNATLFAFFVCVFNLLFMFILRVLLRNPWLAGAAFVAAIGFAVGMIKQGPIETFWLSMGLYFSLIYCVMVRFGLFAVMVFVTVVRNLEDIPITTDPTNWYAPYGFFVVGLIAAFAVIGFKLSLGGKPVFAESSR
jgi:serine/threonine-protein kinase